MCIKLLARIMKASSSNRKFRSVTRVVTASFEAKALYTSEREHLSLLLLTEIVKVTSRQRHQRWNQHRWRRVTLPCGTFCFDRTKASVRTGKSKRMQFVLNKGKTGKRTGNGSEAQGISDFQKIVNQGLNSQLLTWKG